MIDEGGLYSSKSHLKCTVPVMGLIHPQLNVELRKISISPPPNAHSRRGANVGYLQ